MPKPRLAFLIAALWTLSACQVPGAAGSKPKPGASTTVSAASLLAKPDGESTLVAGKVEIDAHYLLGTGKGKLIGSAAGNVIAAGGGNLIGSAAGNLIGSAAGNLIGSAAGNLIGKRKYDLLAAAADKTEVGETLPAAEMEIMVYSLADGQPLTLGKDKDGKAVLSIYTNAAGAYQVYLPANISGKNLRVVAKVPDSTDARLDYQLVTSFGETSNAEITEDTALASAFLREAFVSRMEAFFMDNDKKGGFDGVLPASAKAIAGTLLKDIDEAIATGNVSKLPPDKHKALARKTTDVLLAYVDLNSLKMPSGDDGAIPHLTKLFQKFREAATTKMRADETYFKRQQFLTDAAKYLPEGFSIQRPSDLNDFMLKYLLTSTDNDNVSMILDEMLVSVGLPEKMKLEANDAMQSLVQAIALTMLTNPDAKAEVLATIKKGQ